MKTHTIPCLLLTIAGIASTRCGLAQHRSSVGVHITLLPIQAICIETSDSDAGNAEMGSAYAKDSIDNQKISAFGTAAYELTVDRQESTQLPYPPAWVSAQREPEAPRGPADTTTEAAQALALPESKPLVFYSIRVN